MSEQFDPYYVWLGIGAKNQPPNHYRLLGIDLYEQNGDVISNAADRQMMHIRSAAIGKYGDHAQKLLAEISVARVCYLDPQRKAAYDDLLRKEESVKAPPPIAVSVSNASAELSGNWYESTSWTTCGYGFTW